MEWNGVGFGGDGWLDGWLDGWHWRAPTSKKMRVRNGKKPQSQSLPVLHCCLWRWCGAESWLHSSSNKLQQQLAKNLIRKTKQKNEEDKEFADAFSLEVQGKKTEKEESICPYGGWTRCLWLWFAAVILSVFRSFGHGTKFHPGNFILFAGWRTECIQTIQTIQPPWLHCACPWCPNKMNALCGWSQNQDELSMTPELWSFKFSRGFTPKSLKLSPKGWETMLPDDIRNYGNFMIKT